MWDYGSVCVTTIYTHTHTEPSVLTQLQNKVCVCRWVGVVHVFCDYKTACMCLLMCNRYVLHPSLFAVVMTILGVCVYVCVSTDILHCMGPSTSVFCVIGIWMSLDCTAMRNVA